MSRTSHAIVHQHHTQYVARTGHDLHLNETLGGAHQTTLSVCDDVYMSYLESAHIITPLCR